tara:strand:- start:514 stop:1359 length:846 start_codon:yes stop_codon:yes gene_type:complete
MNLNNTFLILITILLTVSCSGEKVKKSVIIEKSLDLQVQEAYQEGKKSLEEGDVLFAAKKFNEAEILFPQSKWAPKSSLMAAYSYYSQDYYSDAIMELDRFIRVYPLNKNLDYAHYLLALCYYEQIVDEKKDVGSMTNAKDNFNIVMNKYPNTEYAIDSVFKVDLIDDIIASKEMYIGRYYFEKQKWIAAINRFRTVVDNYETTVYTEEALHRLVEIHYRIGLENEAKKYAKLLGYNYQSSRWYEQSYIIFDKKYEKNRISLIKKNNKTKEIIKKFKSLIN